MFCSFQPLQSNKSIDLNGKVITGKADVSAHLVSYQSVKLRPVIEWKTLFICGVSIFTNSSFCYPKSLTAVSLTTVGSTCEKVNLTCHWALLVGSLSA